MAVVCRGGKDAESGVGIWRLAQRERVSIVGIAKDAGAGRMWNELLIALCLVMIIEGMLPFISPGQWRQALVQLLQMDDVKIRGMGLASMLIGMALLYVVH
jgi:hypothetical protein